VALLSKKNIKKTVELLPIRVKAQDILQKKRDACDIFNNDLRNHGFAFIELSDNQKQLLSNLKEAGRQYFTHSAEEKAKNKDIDSFNLGYVSADVREYLKLRITDAESFWPKYPLDFRDHFTKSYNFMHELAWACLETLATNKVKNNEPLLTTQKLSVIQEFAYKKSNISLIHYYPSTPNADKLACAEHRGDIILLLLIY